MTILRGAVMAICNSDDNNDWNGECEDDIDDD